MAPQEPPLRPSIWVARPPCPSRFPSISSMPLLQSTQPRGIIEVNRCLSIKGAEDAINKPHAFEISTTDQNMYFIADSDKVTEQSGPELVVHPR